MIQKDRNLTDGEHVEFLLKWIAVLEEYTCDRNKGEVPGDFRSRINALFFSFGSPYFVGKNKDDKWYVGNKNAAN